MKAKICFLFLLVAIVLSPFFIYLFDNYNKNNFSCWGNISFKRLEGTYSVKVRYVFNGDSGKVITIGEYN